VLTSPRAGRGRVMTHESATGLAVDPNSSKLDRGLAWRRVGNGAPRGEPLQGRRGSRLRIAVQCRVGWKRPRGLRSPAGKGGAARLTGRRIRTAT
jgi:hypothetical protein